MDGAFFALWGILGNHVWFPEGEIMEHGASPNGDVTVLFVTNKSFRIDYVE